MPATILVVQIEPGPIPTFIISAPASTACLATDAFVVSIEISFLGFLSRIFSITGITLFNSSDSEIYELFVIK